MVKNNKKVSHMAARIKKMMQADEDVGKISQATPHLICMRGTCLWFVAVKIMGLINPCITLALPWLVINPCDLNTARGMELFLQKLVQHSAEIAQQAGSKTLTPSHLYVLTH